MITITIKPSPHAGQSDRDEYVIHIDDNGHIVQHPDNCNANIQHHANSHGTLYPFMKRQIALLHLKRHYRTAEIYLATLRSLQQFRQGADIELSHIDSPVINRYEDYLKARRLKYNTISFYMRTLRAVYNKAVTEGLTTDRKPFHDVYTGIGKTRKRAIPYQDIKAILNCVCPTRSMAFARDMFLFSFYTRGMSFIDMAYLLKSDLRNGILSYKRKKTGQDLQIRWEPCMQQLVDKYTLDTTPYLLPIIKHADGTEYKQYRYRQCEINKQLKRLGELAHIRNTLSMYVARHSWASIAKEQNIPLGIISDGMGHHSLNTTQIYLASINADAIDAANAKIISLFKSPEKREKAADFHKPINTFSHSYNKTN